MPKSKVPPHFQRLGLREEYHLRASKVHPSLGIIPELGKDNQ